MVCCCSVPSVGAFGFFDGLLGLAVDAADDDCRRQDAQRQTKRKRKTTHYTIESNYNTIDACTHTDDVAADDRSVDVVELTALADVDVASAAPAPFEVLRAMAQ